MRSPANFENLDEYRWLVSSEARPWLEKAAMAEDDPSSLLATTIVLRRDLGPSRTHLVIAQAQLRRRAKKKFSCAERMFFTRQLLEQATDEQIAHHKSLRFPPGEPVADLYCGIGGDLFALANRCRTQGVDHDHVAALLAETNCAALGLETTPLFVGDAAGFELAGFAAWHLDPSWRTESHGSLRAQQHDAELAAVEQLLSANPRGALKLPPDAAVSPAWQDVGELEWIGSDAHCRQLVAWFGDLARHPGQRTATIFPNCSEVPFSLRGTPGLEVPLSAEVGTYVFEPDPTVLAAELTGQLALMQGLQAISPKAPYLTGNEALECAGLSCFEVLETLPFSLRRVRTLLRQRSIGQLEVRRRGVRLAPEQVLAELSPSGDEAATLLLMAVEKKVLAILCRRLEKQSSTS